MEIRIVPLFLAVRRGAQELAFVFLISRAASGLNRYMYRLMFHFRKLISPAGRVFARRGAAALLLLATGVVAPACTTPLLREADVTSLNDRYRDRVFVTATDIQPTFSTTDSDAEPEVIYPAGTRVKIWIESDEDWIRVRATPVADKREHNPGKIVIYIFRDFLKEDGESEEVQERYPVNRLEAEIAEILTEVGA